MQLKPTLEELRHGRRWHDWSIGGRCYVTRSFLESAAIRQGGRPNAARILMDEMVESTLEDPGLQATSIFSRAWIRRACRYMVIQAWRRGLPATDWVPFTSEY